MAHVKVLDCTLRDGGYYNDWNFGRGLVTAYLHALSAARVDAVEIGFRLPPQNRFVGPFGYSTDDYLRTLPLRPPLLVAVMVNAKDVLSAPGGPIARIDELFQDASQSPVGLVRVAVNFREACHCRPIVSRLKEKGYHVALNLMQASMASPTELKVLSSQVDSWQLVDILYLADSIGNMNAMDMECAVRTVADAWNGPIGVHTHNNKGWAVSNALAGVNAGATWIDGTVLGMGRGAGNAETEYLLLELKERGSHDYCPDALFPLVMDEFEHLRRRYGWGASLPYYLSGSYGIHPTYVQEMLGRNRSDSDHLISALEFLKNSGGNVYSDAHLQRAMRGDSDAGEGTWSAEQWANNRRLLIVGPGPGTREHLDALCHFVERTRPIVVCLNVNHVFPVEKVTAYAACHRTRVLLDAEKYSHLQRPLVVPFGTLPPAVREKCAGVEVLDYGMAVRPDTFVSGPTGCVIPVSLVAAYVMALAEAGGATDILLAGFDGYDDPADQRRIEMAHALACYQSRPAALPLLAITPSTYDVPKASVYSPGL